MTDTDCSKCPTCVIERTSAVLRAANVQVCGVMAMRTTLGPGISTFGLREDTPLSAEVAKALSELVGAYLASLPTIKRGRPITAENDHDILTIEVAAVKKPRTYYKICYHVKTPPVAAG